jgi:hypothetical protein
MSSHSPGAVRLFLGALSKETVFLLSGIASVILAIVGEVFGKKAPTYLFGMAAIICIVVACYRVWKREYDLRIAAEHTTVTIQAEAERQIAALKGTAKERELEDALRAATQLRTLLDNVAYWHMTSSHQFGVAPDVGALLPHDWVDILATVCKYEPDLCAELQRAGTAINHAQRLIKEVQAAPQMFRNSRHRQDTHEALGGALEPLKMANAKMARRAHDRNT